jgi:hypothetical protein
VLSARPCFRPASDQNAVKIAAWCSERAPTLAFAGRRAGKRTGGDDMSQPLSRTASCHRPRPTSKIGSASGGMTLILAPTASNRAQPGDHDTVRSAPSRQSLSRSRRVAGRKSFGPSPVSSDLRVNLSPIPGGMSQIGRIVTLGCRRSGGSDAQMAVIPRRRCRTVNPTLSDLSWCR